MTLGQNAFADLFDLPAPPEIPEAAVTAIVLCHNEALRLPDFLAHHLAAGVGHFLVVDNGSDDGSAEILDAHPNVTRLPSSRAYADCKSLWRQVLADHYLPGRWAAFPDVDELLIAPGWPTLSLADYTALLDRHGAGALFTVMVDMYPEAALAQVAYIPGHSLIEAAPFFDAGNYRLRSYGRRDLQVWPTPPVNVRGGARERLFPTGTQDAGWRTRLAAFAFSMDRSLAPGKLRRRLDKTLSRFVETDDLLPNMSKVALLKWQVGTKFRGGVHRVSRPYVLGPDIGALLHFKYFGDFADRAAYAAARGQHVDGARHYKAYARRAGSVTAQSLMFEASRRFEGVSSLVDAGLMRDILRHRS